MATSTLRSLAKKLGLRIGNARDLGIRRERNGEGWKYIGPRGRRIAARRLTARFDRLAVPPAFVDVAYARDPKAHLQAVGRDTAGRLQYIYHPDWSKVREARKAERLCALVEVLPRIRRALTQRLTETEITREFVLACVVELIATTAIRAGSEEYAKQHKTRGAATLLKSNVECDGASVQLNFRAKGGKQIRKTFANARLAEALGRLKELPGKRLFQYRDEAGAVRPVTANDVNAYLKSIGDGDVSLKDFRTLCATAEVLEALAKVEPAPNVTERRKQINEALKSAADRLHNTVAICRKSYVHPAVITAFEAGVLKQFADQLKTARSPARAETVVVRLVESETPT